MISKSDSIWAMNKLGQIRALLVARYPFFGFVAMHLTLGIAEVETACTDGKRIIFDPDFLKRLSDEEVLFVFCHEVMHVCLNHPLRSTGKKNAFLWNLACDIIVNSNILQSLGMETITVDGAVPVFKGPSEEEGYKFTAEEMYEILVRYHAESIIESFRCSIVEDKKTLDNHDYWEEVELSLAEQEELSQIVQDAAQKCEGRGLSSNIPSSIQKMVIELKNKRQIPWKKVCRDFIRSLDQTSNDYNYRPPDRRDIDESVIYPGYNQTDEEMIKNVLVFVDKSGSIGKEQIMTVMNEILYALREKVLTGKIAFFDEHVALPVCSFSTIHDVIKNGVPMPEGGTSFGCIFDYIQREMKGKDISGIVIMTDGYAPFPDEASANGIPVLWVLVESQVTVPCGRSIHINEI